MLIEVLKGHERVSPYLDQVKAGADDHRSALGFLPAAVYEESSSRGRLWVAISLGDGKYLGHLLFGGTYPDLRVVQLFVLPDHQQQGVASHLVHELVEYGQVHQYLAITARVASDLAANKFWERCGFLRTRTVQGGKTTNRKIHIRVRALDVPRLFDLPVATVSPVTTIAYEMRPVLYTPQYALDINAILDLVRHRQAYGAASALIRAALNHIIQVVVTAEAAREIERSCPLGQKQDPLLEFMRQLPTLPSLESAYIEKSVEELRRIVFPGRSKGRKRASQDESDLVHLATCIHHKVDGFVTSENALLRSALEIRRLFGLEVVSPYDFLDSGLEAAETLPDVTAITRDVEVCFEQFEESRRPEVEKFLGTLGVADDGIREALSPGASGSGRRRIYALVDGEMTGLAAWNRGGKLRREIVLHLYVDESKRESHRVIDHVLEAVLREESLPKVFGIRLVHGLSQTITRSIALKRGFRSAVPTELDAMQPLYKIGVRGTLPETSWNLFSNELRRLAKIETQVSMPTFKEMELRGLLIAQRRNNTEGRIDLFELETLMSPGLFLFSGRSGAVVPIRETYAEELLGGVRSQLSFLPGREALLSIEKAYFRSPRQAKILLKGMPLVLYVSGKGGRAIGHARVTSTQVLPFREVVRQYERQGVLSAAQLESLADKKGHIHVFTFDNFTPFTRPIPYRELKDLGCVDAANYITVTPLNAEQLRCLMTTGYSEEGK